MEQGGHSTDPSVWNQTGTEHSWPETGSIWPESSVETFCQISKQSQLSRVASSWSLGLFAVTLISQQCPRWNPGTSGSHTKPGFLAGAA